jgi:hypothetical protein
MTAPLRPFFSFYGGKWRIAPKYPKPVHDMIIEPFAGSAGYATRYPERQVILVERDPQIAAIWRWLITTASPDDILSLPRLKRGECLNDYEMPQEARWLMGMWVGQGRATPGNKVSEFGSRRQRHERVANQLQYIRHWSIIEGSYWQAPDMSATWFIDAPYQIAGQQIYRFNAGTIDYEYLAGWCRTRQGQTMVCENDSAQWLPFTELVAQWGIQKKTSKEVVWLNETTKQDCRLAA